VIGITGIGKKKLLAVKTLMLGIATNRTDLFHLFFRERIQTKRKKKTQKKKHTGKRSNKRSQIESREENPLKEQAPGDLTFSTAGFHPIRSRRWHSMINENKKQKQFHCGTFFCC
jgi:hypothetical protein